MQLVDPIKGITKKSMPLAYFLGHKATTSLNTAKVVILLIYVSHEPHKYSTG